MQYLSFNTRFIPYKHIVIYGMAITNIFLFSFTMYLLFTDNINLSKTSYFFGYILTYLYIVVSSNHLFHLFISKTLSFDNKYLYIWKGKKRVQKICLCCVSRISRRYHFFYVISFKETCNANNNDVYFFISPNPPFTTPDNVKQFIKLINYEKYN